MTYWLLYVNSYYEIILGGLMVMSPQKSDGRGRGVDILGWLLRWALGLG